MSEKLKMRRQENDEAKKIEKMREREDERITKRVWKWECIRMRNWSLQNENEEARERESDTAEGHESKKTRD